MHTPIRTQKSQYQSRCPCLHLHDSHQIPQPKPCTIPTSDPARHRTPSSSACATGPVAVSGGLTLSPSSNPEGIKNETNSAATLEADQIRIRNSCSERLRNAAAGEKQCETDSERSLVEKSPAKAPLGTLLVNACNRREDAAFLAHACSSLNTCSVISWQAPCRSAKGFAAVTREYAMVHGGVLVSFRVAVVVMGSTDTQGHVMGIRRTHEGRCKKE